MYLKGQNGVRRVIDDHVHTGGQLEGADIPSLTADDAPLHLVIRQRHSRDRRLGCRFGRDPLHRKRHDLLRFAVRVALGRFANLAQPAGRVGQGFVFKPTHQLGLRLIGAESRQLLELAPLLGDELVELLLFRGRHGLASPEFGSAPLHFLFAALERLACTIELCFALEHPLLLAFELDAALSHILLMRLPKLEDFLLARHDRAPPQRLRLALRLVDDAHRAFFCDDQRALLLGATPHGAESENLALLALDLARPLPLHGLDQHLAMGRSRRGGDSGCSLVGSGLLLGAGCTLALNALLTRDERPTGSQVLAIAVLGGLCSWIHYLTAPFVLLAFLLVLWRHRSAAIAAAFGATLLTWAPFFRWFYLWSTSRPAVEGMTGTTRLASLDMATNQDAIVPIAVIVLALQGIASGTPPISPAIARRMLAFFQPAAVPEVPALTERETEVLKLVATGMSYKEIADVLEIAEGTVMSRLFYARKKLQKVLAPLQGGA